MRDMVRVSDGRMSGTAYGTVVLHVAPESAAGGPLGLVRTGDPVALDVARPARCTSTSPTPVARREHVTAAARDARPAAGSSSTASTSSRPTGARGSISWWASAADTVTRDSH